MATLRERIENNPAVFFLGAIVAGFLAGTAAYEGLLQITNQRTIFTDPRSNMSAIHFDFDRPGSDIGDFLPMQYPGQCQNACAATPKCKAWAFQRPNKCWLKNGKPSETPETGSASGVKNE